MATTLLISDLHLGGRLNTDVLRAAEPRRQLKERFAGIDRLILLGDTVEFRHSPQREALREGLPILADLAAALPKGAELVMVPGNHDWTLLEGWNARRAAEREPVPMGLDESISATDASEAAAAIEQAVGRTVELRYPGLWIDDGVYAMHGHYLDVHGLLPTVERIGAGALQRLSGTVPLRATPADYERVLAPWYAFIGASVERLSSAASTRRATTGARAYDRIKSQGASARAFSVGLRAGVAALNATGIGPLSAELSGQAMIASALHAIDEVDARLNLGAEHLIFGHCHRAGPLDDDAPDTWRSRVGTKLWNTGNWVYEPRFQASAGSDGAYWPGSAVVVETGKPPRLERLLTDLSEDALMAGRPIQARSGPAQAEGGDERRSER